MELCFWKTAGEAGEVLHGYDLGKSGGRMQKASHCSEDEEEKLSSAFAQFKEMKERDESGQMDVLTSLETFMEGSGKPTEFNGQNAQSAMEKLNEEVTQSRKAKKRKRPTSESDDE